MIALHPTDSNSIQAVDYTFLWLISIFIIWPIWLHLSNRDDAYNLAPLYCITQVVIDR